MFGARARSSLSAQGSANLCDAPRTPGRDTGAKPVLTASPVDSKPHPVGCKQSGVIPSSGALLPEKAFGPPCQVEDSQLVDSEQASDASTVPILATLLSLICGFRPDVPRTSEEEGPGMQEQLVSATIVYHRHRPWKALPESETTLTSVYQGAHESTRQI